MTEPKISPEDRALPSGLGAGDRAGRTADIGDAKVDSGDRRKIEASR